jgi:hypothetical protein
MKKQRLIFFKTQWGTLLCILITAIHYFKNKDLITLMILILLYFSHLINYYFYSNEK